MEHSFCVVQSPTTGNGAGCYLLASPSLQDCRLTSRYPFDHGSVCPHIRNRRGESVSCLLYSATKPQKNLPATVEQFDVPVISMAQDH